MLAVAVGQVGTALAAPFVALAGYPLAYVMWLAHVAARPARRAGERPRVAGGRRVPGCGGSRVACAERGRRVVLGAVLALALGAVLSRTQAAGLAAPAGLRITFLDVGQGDATLIQMAAQRDPGRHGPARRPRARAPAPRGRAAAGPARGHPRAGRSRRRCGRGAGRAAGGARARRARRRPRRRRRADGGRGRPARGAAGRRARRRGAARRRDRAARPVAARPGAPSAGADPNQRAIVAEADAGGVRTLLTADAESDVLAGLDLGPVDVLKVSHHGSADPGLPALLSGCAARWRSSRSAATTPTAIRRAATVARCGPRARRVLRTDRDGSVRVEPAGAGCASRPCVDDRGGRLRVVGRSPRLVACPPGSPRT